MRRVYVSLKSGVGLTLRYRSFERASDVLGVLGTLAADAQDKTFFDDYGAVLLVVGTQVAAAMLLGERAADPGDGDGTQMEIDP